MAFANKYHFCSINLGKIGRKSQSYLLFYYLCAHYCVRDYKFYIRASIRKPGIRTSFSYNDKYLCSSKQEVAILAK